VTTAHPALRVAAIPVGIVVWPLKLFEALEGSSTSLRFNRDFGAVNEALAPSLHSYLSPIGPVFSFTPSGDTRARLGPPPSCRAVVSVVVTQNGPGCRTGETVGGLTPGRVIGPPLEPWPSLSPTSFRMKRETRRSHNGAIHRGGVEEPSTDSDEAEHLVRGKPTSRSERSRSPGPKDAEHPPGRSVATLVRFSSPTAPPRSRWIGSSSSILLSA
jgi:hypothetical protein